MNLTINKDIRLVEGRDTANYRGDLIEHNNDPTPGSKYYVIQVGNRRTSGVTDVGKRVTRASAAKFLEAYLRKLESGEKQLPRWLRLRR